MTALWPIFAVLAVLVLMAGATVVGTP